MSLCSLSCCQPWFSGSQVYLQSQNKKTKSIHEQMQERVIGEQRRQQEQAQAVCSQIPNFPPNANGACDEVDVSFFPCPSPRPPCRLPRRACWRSKRRKTCWSTKSRPSGCSVNARSSCSCTNTNTSCRHRMSPGTHTLLIAAII